MATKSIDYTKKIKNKSKQNHYAYMCLFYICVHQRPDEEVVVDQGGTSSVLNIHYEKEELESE